MIRMLVFHVSVRLFKPFCASKVVFPHVYVSFIVTFCVNRWEEKCFSSENRIHSRRLSRGSLSSLSDDKKLSLHGFSGEICEASKSRGRD